MTPEAPLAETFEEQRPRLLAVAHRVLGSRADAEDAVQEAWLRLSRQHADSIDNVAGWLTTVVGRICIDTLRSRSSRAEVTPGADIPELVVTEDVDSPEDAAVIADSVGLAMLVVLGSLRPDERLAFVLHDLFAVPFAEIGQILTSRATQSRCWPAGRAGRCRTYRRRPRGAAASRSSARSSTHSWPQRVTATSMPCCAYWIPTSPGSGSPPPASPSGPDRTPCSPRFGVAREGPSWPGVCL